MGVDKTEEIWSLYGKREREREGGREETLDVSFVGKLGSTTGGRGLGT